MSGKKDKQKVRTWRKEEKPSRILGFTLIGVGSLSLVLTLVFSGLPGFSSVSTRFSKLWMQVTSSVGKWFKSPEKETSPWDLSRVKPIKDLKAIPSAKGWSALDSFYATHPPVEGEAEYYLDPALWREPAKPAATAGGSGTADAPGGPGEGATAPSRRNLGVWTGPADGVQMVDTSIRPAHEQLKRQDSMAATDAFLPMAGDSTAHGIDVDTNAVPATADPNVEKPTSQKSLHVEFWESPVHYKGYQLNGNNLILYGIDESDSLRFENHTDGVWMYHKSAVYRLTTSSELQRFELISGYEEEVGSPAAEEIAE